MADSTNPKTMAGPVIVNIKGTEFMVQTTTPGPMVPIEDLEKSLEKNRQLIVESQEKMKKMVIDEYYNHAPPWKINYLSPTKDAIMAHLNINILVPIINLRGGRANFTKLEAMSVQKHVEVLRNKAEKMVLMKGDPNQTTANYYYAFVVMIIIFAFLLLLS